MQEIPSPKQNGNVESEDIRTSDIEANVEKRQLNTSEVIKIIVLGSDWEEALTSIVVEQGLDPLNIDITRLADAFMLYVQRLQNFDFRIPGRFILIASILLTMKTEALLSEEEQRLSQLRATAIEQLNLDAPLLVPPPKRTATRNVNLPDLIAALNKTFEIKTKKEPILLAKRKIPEIPIPNKPEDIEGRIATIYNRIKKKGIIKFTDLVPAWRRKEIIGTFIPMLHLCHRGKVSAHQPTPFREILIKLR
jgi:segregation and condensation protein A